MGYKRKARKSRGHLTSVNDQLPAAERRLIKTIQEALSFDLLSANYRSYADPCDHYVWGHCYIATEAFYHLYGKRAGYKPRYIVSSGGGTHWWLEHVTTGRIADPTEPQVSRTFDYSAGSGQAFQPPSPNRRTREL